MSPSASSPSTPKLADLRDSARVLVVGIDQYRNMPLHGAVNDIDEVQRVFLDTGVPVERIRRLASPRPGTRHATEVPEQPATLANLRAALAELVEETREGDRVFFYYSGHGMRAKIDAPGPRATYREALVAADIGQEPGSGLLFDHEINDILGQLAARTRSVTCVFDCCHSAGVLRSETARYLHQVRDLCWPAEISAPAPRHAAAGVARSFDATRVDGFARALVEDCHVVCACMNHEFAYEVQGDDGVWHGRFTRAFVRALRSIRSAEHPTLPWTTIWQRICAEVEEASQNQHPWMGGNPARAVLAGSPVHSDPGLVILRVEDGYEIAAGTVAGVTEGAEIAVYGAEPAYFPPLGSDRDRAAQIGRLRVVSAEASRAKAELHPNFGRAFELPPGARGRVIAAGRAARLSCAVVPPDAAIAADLRASPLLEVVGEGARVRLERRRDRWLVTDNLHEPDPETALLALTDAELPRARAVLEHYARYAQPIRLAEAVRDHGALQLHVLASRGAIPSHKARAADLPVVPSLGGSTYELPDGAPVCFRVHNARRHRLYVTLVNVAASGRVQLLGDRVIDGGTSHIFYCGAAFGRPFTMTVPDDRRRCIDLLIAVGTTHLHHDLGYLRVDHRFADILAGTPVDEEAVTRSARIVEDWTATQAVLITTRPPVS